MAFRFLARLYFIVCIVHTQCEHNWNLSYWQLSLFLFFFFFISFSCVCLFYVLSLRIKSIKSRNFFTFSLIEHFLSFCILFCLISKKNSWMQNKTRGRIFFLVLLDLLRKKKFLSFSLIFFANIFF